MKRPTPIDASRFFEFVQRSELALLFVSAHPLHTFNRTLGERLAAEHEGIIIGAMDLRRLVLSGPSVLRFLHQGLRACGAPTAFGVLPGYHLFGAGQLLAWDSGLPGLDDVAALARSALLGTVWWGVSSDWTFVRRAVLLGADQAAAERVARRFREAVASARARREERPRAEAPPVDELFWAYRVLGVLPTATDREVHEAWKRRRAEVHPDLAGSDPVEFDRRSRLSRDINHARDVIVNHRYPGTRGATHAWAS